MATLSLKISLEGGKVVKTIQFDPSTTVYDACRIIREKILEATTSDPKEFGLFLASEEDNKKGIWLEASRSLDYYMLRNGDLLEYNKKTRNLRVRMLDGTVKTLLVDDSQIVANLMVVICTKIGITNYDEYGLVREEQREEPDPCEKPNYGTLTLKRRHHDKERDVKMDQLRKKLRTDDEVNWVEPSKTLREQGIDVTETLLLRRKLFFSDRNVDSRDPVQLNLLYVQARDAILDGTHPVTQDKACEFAGIQCQIQFGDHKEDKHTPGFLDLKEFLPASYVKVKGIEKKVFKEHRKHASLSELDAKVLYTKSARDLKTYGVAFFLVKEKMKGKNKLVPRLLGVTKDSVLRLDEKTKEILQTWPLTTVRRWCASPNTFTLDFGDYSDQYYSVQTTEAEQILQVIAGYIDIIVRKQRAKEHLGIEGDEGSAMLEDSVSPSKANIIQHDTFKSGKVNTESVAKPAVHRPGAEGAKPFAVGHMTGAQQTTVSGQVITGHSPPAAGAAQQTSVTSVLSEPQRALLTTITAGRDLIRRTEEGLTRASLPELGDDAASVKWKQVTLDTNKQAVTGQIAAMNAATAQVVTLTSGGVEEVDHTAVGAAITTITSTLPAMGRGVRLMAALLDDGPRLLDAARRLCRAFCDLLAAAEPAEPHDTHDTLREPRQNLLNAASRVGEASTSVLHTIGEETEEDKETQDILLSLAKAVANTTAALVLKAKNVAAACRDDQQLQNNIITAATNCALATSQLVACAKVVAPTLESAACREQVVSAARYVRSAVERVVSAAPPALASQHQLPDAARRLTDELDRLLAHCTRERQPSQATVTERTVESVMTASERLAAAGDPADMVRHARLLGQATAHLITSIKTEAESQPSDSQRKLLAAAKLLADATARMVEAARRCASCPQDREQQEALRRAAEEVRDITADYAQGQDIVGSQFARLQESAIEAASSASQLITSAQNAAQHNTNKYSQEALWQECTTLSERAPRLAAAARASAARPAAASRRDLLTAADTFLQASGAARGAARGVLPTVPAPAARQLADTTHHLAACETALRSAVNRARISCKGLELEAAAEMIRGLQAEFEEYERAAQALQLTPLPGQTEEWSRAQLSSSARMAASSMAALAGTEPGAVGAEPGAAPALADALRDFAAGARAAAALHPEPADSRRVLTSGRQVITSSLTLVETIKHYLSTSEQIDTTTITSIAKDITKGLETTMEAAPSHTALDTAIEDVNQTLHILDMGEFPPSNRPYGELQAELLAAAEELNSASSDVAAGAGGAGGDLGAAAQRVSRAFTALLAPALELAGRAQDREIQTLMVNCMKTVTVNSSKLLSTAKSVSQDLTRPNARNQLAAAARAVTDSINRLVDVCTEAAPGQKECLAAIKSISSSRALLAAPTQPLSELGYFSCVDSVLEQSKALSEGMSGMAGAVKRSQHEPFAAAVAAVAAAVTHLVESTAQAAYLVAVSDSSSAAGRPGLVDQAQFARAADAIQRACRTLADPASDQHQVLSAATVIAKHTSSLCNACRLASGRSSEPAHKRHFVQAAKDVANSTAALVKEIKALDADYSEANRGRCAEATGPLVEAVRGLCQFADRPEFAGVPARVSDAARARQDCILQCGRDIISGSCAMLESGRLLALTPQERSHWQSLAAHSRTVSDSIKALVTNVREKAPGQKECTNALDTLERLLRDLDQASIQAVGQELEPRRTNTLQGYSEQIENSVTEMMERVEPLRQAAASQAEHLGHCATQLVSYAEAVVTGSIGCASLVTESALQTGLLGLARTVVEAGAALVAAARTSAGNHRATSAHAETEAAAQLTRRALHELGAHARELSAARGAVRPLLDLLDRAVGRLTAHRLSLISSYDESDSFVDYQARMIGAAKDIARLATDIKAKSVTDPSRLMQLCNEICVKYDSLAQDSVGAAATMPNADVANSIRAAVVDLGEELSELVKAGGQCRLEGGAHTQHVGERARLVNEKVVSVLGALQAGSRGTQACIDATATIAAIIGDLDTTILFASAGTLHSEKETDTFSDHRENILKTAKILVEDTKTLVGGAAGTQEQLAAAANSSVSTIVQLCEVVKQGAMSLGAGSEEPQVLLLNAARDVAAGLRDLAAATTAASGKHHQHPDMTRLKHAAKRLTETTKRWSLPTNHTAPRLAKRRSLAARIDYNSCDSETDLFQSDQEDELVKLLDYSSQDDDVSPSIFHDNCEEVIAYIENLLKEPSDKTSDDDVNDRYNMAARNSLIDMDWRVLKYGENIFLGEVKKMVDLVVELFDRLENKRKRQVLKRLKVNNDLDSEMKRLSQVIENLDTEFEENVTITSVTTVQTVDSAKKPKLQDSELTSPVFKIKKVKPVNLTINLDIGSEANITPLSPEQTQKGESPEIVVNPETKEKIKLEFWKMFNDDSEIWKAIAKKNLEKMEETRRELERFSGHELVLGEFQTEIDKYEKEKATLQSFIDDVDNSKAVKEDLKYNKKYEDIVLKLIEFARKDFIFKGFDPLIEQLKNLSNMQIVKRKKKVNIQDIINIYTQTDISKYTYEELCLLERYYKEIIRKYKYEHDNKENVVPRDDRSPSLTRETETQSAPPSYHKNVILNVHSRQNLTKNVHSYSNTTITNGDSLKRSNKRDEKSKNNVEIFDLTRTYPMEYYANNWWSIYENILKSREQQYGSIDNWWRFYEAILNKEVPDDEDLRRLRAVVQHRSKRPKSRLEEHMRMLEDVKRQSFTEVEDVARRDQESVMVTNVTSLLKTVKAVEDEHTRGTRALESTIEAISQEIEVLLSDTPPQGTATPEDLIRCTRQMTTATARAVAAGNANKQDQLTAAANLGRKTVLDLLVACKAAAWTADSAEVRQRTRQAGAAAAEAYRALLGAVLTAAGGGGAGGGGGSADRQPLADLSRRVARAVADIIAAAEALKGSDWVDPDDPTVIAESELLGAAASIDAAARKLDALRPRKSLQPQETDESLNFDEMILEAAKSIIAATSALVRAASAAQRELIDQGAVARRPAASSADGQWSEGLVSAARLVAAAACALVDAANALVQGAASEERLASSARHVAASTAQLLVACKVKADPASEATRRLQAAGAAVIRSTDGLVRAARDAMTLDDERSLVLNRRMVGGIAQEIDARSEVLRIEKELEEARGRLTAIRQAKYKLRATDSSADETDTDHYDTNQRVKSPSSSFVNTTYSPNSTYSQHHTQNTTNLSQNISNLSQSIHGTSNAYNPPQTGYNPPQSGHNPSQTGYNPPQTGYNPSQTGYNQTQTSYNQTQTGYSPSQPLYNQSSQSNGYNQYQREEKQYTVQSPTFSSFRPQEENKQNYEGFTTRQSTTMNDRTMMPNSREESVVVKSLRLPEVRTAVLVDEGREGRGAKPQPPPRRASLLNYETRLYDTPRPVNEYKKEEQSHYESSQYTKEQKYGYDAPKTPLSPKFNARELKFETEPIYSSLKKPTTPKSPFDGVGQTFSEHQVSTEAIPGGTKHSEFTVKSESYQSYPKTDFSKIETRSDVKSPFVTSTPSKLESFPDFPKTSTDLVKAATPDFDRISSPYGKEVLSFGGPNYKEETMTEVKEIPNGTQKITTTKIYSSSPVNITSTNTKYEPIKLEGIDELSKSFDNESRYSTLDSRFNTLDSKMSSDTSRSFMRPSDFQTSDYQSSTSVIKTKSPAELTKEIDSIDKKFSKQTITSETIERKSVMTSSHKSETSSTVTKKFGNF